MKCKLKNPILIITALAMALLTSCVTTDSGSSAAGRGGVKPYTKDVCIVTDNKLGSMGDPVSLVHEGQEVKFCCQPCVAKFKANPDKYLARL